MVAGPAAARRSTFTKLSKEKRGRGRGPQASQALLTSRIARDRRPQELDWLSARDLGFSLTEFSWPTMHYAVSHVNRHSGILGRLNFPIEIFPRRKQHSAMWGSVGIANFLAEMVMTQKKQF